MSNHLSLHHTATGVSLLINQVFKQDLEFLPVHSQPLQDARLNYVRAAIVVIILRWGTTSAGPLIAFKYVLIPPPSRNSSKLTTCRTPTVVGFGCNSGAYLIYGIIATATWILPILSVDLFPCTTSTWSHPHHNTLHFPPNWPSCPAFAGKSFACLNACIILVTSVLQFANLYSLHLNQVFKIHALSIWK
jgi:hypothetical protein